MLLQTLTIPRESARRAGRSGPGPARPPLSIPVPGLGRAIEVKIASSRREFAQAFRLLSANYQARGYEEPSTKPFRFTPYHALPETLTVVAVEARRVVATLSLVPDSASLPLPMEGLYAAEVAALRQSGRRLAEATSLADRDLGSGEFLRVFTAMIRLAMQAHTRRGGDCWVIAVNPRHGSFYGKVLGFRRIGPRRPNAAVQGHPAEAYVLDLDGMRANAPAMYAAVFDEPLPDEALFAPPRGPEHARYFGARSTLADHRTINELLLRSANTMDRPRGPDGRRHAWPRHGE